MIMAIISIQNNVITTMLNKTDNDNIPTNIK